MLLFSNYRVTLNCQLTSLIILTASLVLPSFLAHIASLLLMYTRTLVSRPVEGERKNNYN